MSDFTDKQHIAHCLIAGCKHPAVYPSGPQGWCALCRAVAFGQPAPVPAPPPDTAIDTLCTSIADQVVPEYRDGRRSYSCGGHTAKRWQAAWDAAHLALTKGTN